MKNQEILQTMITVGKSLENGSEPSANLVNTLKPFSHINCLPLNKVEVEDETKSLTGSDLIFLLKGFTYVERIFEWPSGSITASKPIFDVLCTRDVDVKQVKELVDWITHNTGNFFNQIRWVHAAELRGYYSSDEEYQAAIKRRKEVMVEVRKKEAEQQEQFEQKAEDQREVRKARRFASHRDRKKSARADLIKGFNDIPIVDQLALIAEDDVHAPNYYPTKCAASADFETIEKLPDDVKQLLVRKLKGRHRGPWGAFKKRLLSVYEPENNHR